MIRYSEQKIDKSDILLVNKVLKSKFITTGPIVEKFEKKICSLVSSKFSVSVTNASSGLIIACKALDLKKNDYVWTTPITFVATCTAVAHCGAKVDFVDIDKKNFLISPSLLEEKLIKTPRIKRPKILILVHLSGFPCDLKEFRKLSKKYNFKIIEDASHALGAKYLDSQIGDCKFSDITVFSFHAVKIITTAEGGVCTTNNKYLSEKMKLYRSHGIVRKIKDVRSNKNYWKYDSISLGYNFRMNDIQAALGIGQIKKLKNYVKERSLFAIYYKKLLKDLPINFQAIIKNSSPSWHLFIILLNKKIRSNFFAYMKSRKIGINFHYKPIFLNSFFKSKKINSYKKNYPNTFYYMNRAVSLPMHNNLNYLKIKYITKNIKKFFKKSAKHL
jgi:UDP-4-amino-4,6-dideoxy-N-acetyl-beta-L-altrosamine transaminase